jgi:hypothetical protein
VPTEIDSNAAAAVFISARFPAHEVQALRTGRRRFLACSLIPPAPHDTLIARMVAFAYVYCAGVEANATRREFPVEAVLLSVHTDAPESGISRAARLIRLHMVVGARCQAGRATSQVRLRVRAGKLGEYWRCRGVPVGAAASPTAKHG